MKYLPEHSTAYDDLHRIETGDLTVTTSEIRHELLNPQPEGDPHAYGIVTAQLEAQANIAHDPYASVTERSTAERNVKKIGEVLDPKIPVEDRREPTEAERLLERDKEHEFFGLWQKYAELTTLNPKYINSRQGAKERQVVVEAMDDLLHDYPQFSRIILKDHQDRADAAAAFHKAEHRGAEYDNTDASGNVTKVDLTPLEQAEIDLRRARDKHDDVVIHGASPGTDPTERSAAIGVTRKYHAMAGAEATARTHEAGDTLRDMLYDEAIRNMPNLDHNAGKDIREAFKDQIETFEADLQSVVDEIENALIMRVGRPDKAEELEVYALSHYDRLVVETQQLDEDIKNSPFADRHSETEVLYYMRGLASTQVRRLAFMRNQVTLMTAPIDTAKIRMADTENFLNKRGRDIEYSEDEQGRASLVEEENNDVIAIFSDGSFKRGDQYYNAEGKKAERPQPIKLETLPPVTNDPDGRRRKVLGKMALGRKNENRKNIIVNTQPLTELYSEMADKMYRGKDAWFRDQADPAKIETARMAIHVLRERLRIELSNMPAGTAKEDVHTMVNTLDYHMAVLEVGAVDEAGEEHSFMKADGSVIVQDVPEMYGRQKADWRIYPDGSKVLLQTTGAGTPGATIRETNLRYSPRGKRYRVLDRYGHLVSVA